MNFEDFIVAEKLSAILQIKKLREEETKLVEAAKAEALAKTREGIEELNILGFNYELTELGQVKGPRKARARRPIDHSPKGTCPICGYATNPAHDKRSHRMQTRKKPFTDAELEERSMKRA